MIFRCNAGGHNKLESDWNLNYHKVKCEADNQFETTECTNCKDGELYYMKYFSTATLHPDLVSPYT